MSTSYSISCFCIDNDGRPSGDPFVLNISSSVTITTFREAVNEELPIEVPTVEDFTLWKLKELKTVEKLKREGGEEGICPKIPLYRKIRTRNLSDVFRTQPLEGYVHVLVQLPREFCHYSLTL